MSESVIKIHIFLASFYKESLDRIFQRVAAPQEDL